MQKRDIGGRGWGLFSQKILSALINLAEGQWLQEPHPAFIWIYSDTCWASSGIDEEVLGNTVNWSKIMSNKKEIDFTFSEAFDMSGGSCKRGIQNKSKIMTKKRERNFTFLRESFDGCGCSYHTWYLSQPSQPVFVEKKKFMWRKFSIWQIVMWRSFSTWEMWRKSIT